MKHRSRVQHSGVSNPGVSNPGTRFAQTNKVTGRDHLSDSFCEIALNSSTTNLNTATHEGSGQGPLQNTSAAILSGASGSYHPAATLSPTRESNVKFKGQPSQKVDKTQSSSVAHSHDQSLEFFESFGLSSSKSSTLPSKQNAAVTTSGMPTRKQQAAGSEFFDQFVPKPSVAQIPNTSSHLFTQPRNAQVQQIIKSRNPTTLSEVPLPKSSQPNVPLQGTSQLFASVKHNNTFDGLTQATRENRTNLFGSSAAQPFATMNQLDVTTDSPPAHVQNSHASSAIAPSGHKGVNLQSSNSQCGPAVSNISQSTSMPINSAPPVKNPQDISTSNPARYKEVSHLSSEPQPVLPVEGQSAGVPNMPFKPMQEILGNSTSLSSGKEETFHGSLKSESAQPVVAVNQPVDIPTMPSPPMLKAQASSKNGPSGNMEISHQISESKSAEQFTAATQPVIPPTLPSPPMASPIIHHSGCKETSHPSGDSESSQQFTQVTQPVDMSSPPTQNSRDSFSNTLLGVEAATQPSFKPGNTQSLSTVTQVSHPVEVQAFPSGPMENPQGESSIVQNSQVTGSSVPPAHKEETPQTLKSGVVPSFPAESKLVQDPTVPPAPDAQVLQSSVSSRSEPSTVPLFNPGTALPDMPPPYKQESPQTLKSGAVPSFPVESKPVQDPTVPPAPDAQVLQSSVSSRGEPSTVPLFNPGTALPGTTGSHPREASVIPPVSSQNSRQNSTNVLSQRPETTSSLFHSEQPPLIQNASAKSTNFSSGREEPAPFSFKSGSAHQHAPASQATRTTPVHGNQNSQFDSAQQLFEPKSNIADVFNVSQQAASVQLPDAVRRNIEANPSTIPSDGKMSSQRSEYNQAMTTPPSNVAHTTSEHTADLENKLSDSSLTRVGSNHSAFHSVSPSPKQSSTSLFEGNTCKSRESPLRPDVEKEKKNMYPASTAVLSSLWENGSQLSVSGLIMPAPSGQELPTEVVNPLLTDIATMPVIQSYSEPPGNRTSALLGTTDAGQSTTGHPMLPSDTTRADAPTSVPEHPQHALHPSAQHHQLVGPRYTSGTTAAAYQDEVPSEVVLSQSAASSNVQHFMSSSQNIEEHRNPVLNTSTKHQTQPVLPPPSQSAPQAVPSHVTMGNYQRPGPQVNQPPSSKEGTQHGAHGMSTYHPGGALPGHSTEHQRFHPEVNRSEAEKAGMLWSDQQQVAGTPSEMTGPGYGGHTGANSAVQKAHSETNVAGQQLSSGAAHQQRRSGVEQHQGATSQYHMPANYEDYDSEEECNRYYDESGKWFWSYKRLRWIPANSAPRKSNRDDYDPEFDSYSEYSRSESSRGRYHSDERERSERRHSRRRGKSSQKHSRGKDLDIRDYNDYIEYYRDYYRDYYRRRSESSGSSDSHRRGTPSGHSSGAQTPRSCSSRSSSRADRSHRSKHHRSYDYEDGYVRNQDYYKSTSRQSSRRSRRRSDSSSYSTSGDSNSLSDSVRGSGYYRQQGREKMADYQLEKVPTPERLTPKQHTVPHIVCKFGTASRVCWVPSKHVVDGERPDIVLAEMKSDAAASKVMVSYPGPLRRGQTHKRDVVRFAKDMALAAFKNLSRSFEQREASFIFWEVLAVMVQQNGLYLGSDIAEVLTCELPDISLGLPEREERRRTSEPHQVTFSQNQDVEYNEDLLSTYRELLLCGKTCDALEFAISSDMWGHALTLSCHLDSQIFFSVMNRFIGNLGENDSLLCLYQHLSQKRLSFLDKKSGSWRNHLAIMIANPSKSPDKDRRNIFALGENLESRGIFEAAHLCYLLAGEPITTENGMILLGTDLMKTRPEFVSPESIQRTEIYEYAKTLRDETFTIPDFQAWKVCYAYMLAESGFNNKAYRYCEIIVDSVVKNPTMFSKVMIAQVYALAVRLHELVFITPGLDWIEKLKRLCDAEFGVVSSENSKSSSEVPQQQLPQEPMVHGNGDQAIAAQGAEMEDQAPSGKEKNIVDRGMTNISKEDQPAPVPSIPTVFVPNMTSSDPQTFPTDPYQIAPTSDVQADVSAQVGQVPYSVNFAGAFISEEPVPNQWNHPYSGVTNTQGVPTSMDSEETSLPSRQPSEIHFYGAEAPGSGDNQLYGGDSFEHLRTVPEPNQPSFTQPEKSAEIEQPASQDNFDYYSMANYQTPADNNVSSVKNEAAPTPKAKEAEKKADEQKKEKQGGGWSIGGFFKSFIPKGKNEMILPDDNNKPIYWDEKLGKWVNTEESEEEKSDLPPPPIDSSLVSRGGPPMPANPAGLSTQPTPPSGLLDQNQPGHAQAPVTTPQSSTPQVATQPAPPSSAPGRFVTEQPEISLVNSPLTTPSRFSRRALGSKGRKSNYVDVLGSSGSTTKPAMDASPLVFQPHVAQSSFVGGPTPVDNETQSSTSSEGRLPPSSHYNATPNLDGQSDSTDSAPPAVPFFNPADYSVAPISTGSRGGRLYPKTR